MNEPPHFWKHNRAAINTDNRSRSTLYMTAVNQDEDFLHLPSCVLLVSIENSLHITTYPQLLWFTAFLQNKVFAQLPLSAESYC